MRLYLIRHGRPDVDTGICYGSSDIGVAAQEHARVLSALQPSLPLQAPVFSSPLRRCSELAVQLADSLGSNAPVIDARLAEMDFGAWEMRAWSDIPREEIDAWANDVSGHRTGGGESVLQMAQRVHAFHSDLLRRGPPHAVVVCHAGTIRLMLKCQHGLPPIEMATGAGHEAHTIAYGELVTLDC